MDLESITSLVESNRYNVDILPQLETFVRHQAENQVYHLDANLTVLKFYQFHPDKTNPNIIALILAKALMNLPNNDITLCLYLISESLHEDETIKTLMLMSSMLESSQFIEFWKHVAALGEFFKSIAGFNDAIRGFIIGVLTLTYRTVPREFLSQVLNTTGADIDAMITERGWIPVKEDPSWIALTQGDEAVAKKSKKVAESIKFQDLARILGAIRS